MCKFILLTISFVIAEIILAFAFSAIAQVYYKKIKGVDFKSIFKGTFERLFISIALVHNLPHALTLFSALKLATRLKHAEPDAENQNKFNDYYLMGNLASVVVAIFYSYAFSNFNEIAIFNRICNS